MAYITLSRGAFFHNLDILCKKLGAKERLYIVLKDNAYGHGLIETAKLSSLFGLRRAVVRDYGEAEKISHLFDEILILSPNPPYKNSKNYSIAISDISTIRELRSGANIHLKIDTGMHRNGIDPNDIETAIEKVNRHRLKLKGVFTHFRSADELSSELFWQQKIWKEIKEKIETLVKKLNLPSPIFHSANSAALLRQNTNIDESARCGIAAYGYHELHPSFGKFNLKPVLKLYAKKLNTKFLKKSQRVGYGGAFCANDDMKISIYDAGYADGIFRYNGVGDFYMGNKKILGKISMDSLCVEGDDNEIIIIEDAKKIAKYFDTISYEILVKLSPSLKRVIID